MEEDLYVYDAILTLPSPLNDVFDMDSIYTTEYSVNYDYRTYRDVTLDVSSNFPTLSVSGAAYISSRMKNINLLYSTVKDIFPVIFDTGVSLPIYYRNYYADPIKPIVSYRLGGGLANGITIEGIGTSKWKFRTKTAVIVVTSSYYYVPNSSKINYSTAFIL